jgi:hypothetical protein
MFSKKGDVRFCWGNLSQFSFESSERKVRTCSTRVRQRALRAAAHPASNHVLAGSWLSLPTRLADIVDKESVLDDMVSL